MLSPALTSILKNKFQSKKSVSKDLFFFVDIKSNSILVVSLAEPSLLCLAVLIATTKCT